MFSLKNEYMDGWILEYKNIPGVYKTNSKTGTPGVLGEQPACKTDSVAFYREKPKGVSRSSFKIVKATKVGKFINLYEQKK